MYSTYETSSHNQNEQVQYVYHCCLCLIFDQTAMAQEQKYLKIIVQDIYKLKLAERVYTK